MKRKIIKLKKQTYAKVNGWELKDTCGATFIFVTNISLFNNFEKHTYIRSFTCFFCSFNQKSRTSISCYNLTTGQKLVL